ncbi:uncharacterized protein [Apostichopus japonicus]|uniref:uncharacterized protein n=1 Tax=Stichopus japonicus TaxID=307972 RepID=UPI003AB37049
MGEAAAVVNTNQGQPGVQMHGQTGPPAAPWQPQVQYAQGTQHPPGVNPHYNAKAGQWTGWIQVSLGTAAILFGIVSVVIDLANSNIGTGIWSGLLFYVITGILGILSSSKKSYDLITAYLVMSIFSSMVSGVCIIIFGVSAASESWYSYYYYDSIPYGARLTIHLLSLFIALVEFVISIIAAAFCCSGNCCTPYSSVATRTVVQYSHVQPNALITAIPQGMVAYNQPYMYPQPMNQAPMYNNFVQPVPMQHYHVQPGMQGHQMMQVHPPQPAGASAMQPSADFSAPADGGAKGPPDIPPPYGP